MVSTEEVVKVLKDQAEAAFADGAKWEAIGNRHSDDAERAHESSYAYRSRARVLESAIKHLEAPPILDPLIPE